jgi:hypothetical protein
MTTYHAIVEPDAKAAFDFLSALYANTNEDGWLNLFHVDKRTGNRVTVWRRLDDVQGLIGPMMELAPRGDTWFSVAPRREHLGEGKRGGVRDCVSIPALWLDVDIASDVHKLPGLPTSYEQGRQLALSLDLAPSAVVRSGYGLQVWWRLHESVPVGEAFTLLKRWQQTWQRLADEAGVHLDNTSNIDRVMRLPGTFNFKGDAPVMVTCKSAGKLYEASEVTDCLDVLSAPSEPKERATTSHLAGSRFNEITDIRQMLINDLRCTLVRTDADGDEHYHYPQSQGDTSCTLYAEDGHLTIWSETMAATLGLELRRPYDPFGIWAAVHYKGDFGLAHAVLVEHGITDQGQPRAPQAPKVRGATQLNIETASMTMPQDVKWIWPGWLPRGKLLVLDADPAAGKSTLMLDIAARISTGADMPDGTPGQAPGNVLLLAGEDDLADTVVPRLMAAGADQRRIHVLKAAYDEAGEVDFALPRDLEALEVEIIKRAIVLVVVDVFDEYIDEKVDTYRNSAIRHALRPIRECAARTGAAFMVLRHLRKQSGDKALYRGNGSIGIIGASRGGWVIGYHPDDEAIRVLASVKINIAQTPPALAFLLMPHPEYACAYVHWQGPLEEMSADALLDPGARASAEERKEKKTKRQICREAMAQLLSEGDMWSNELWEAIKQLKISERTYDDVRSEITHSWPQRMPDGTRGWRVRLKGSTTESE